MISTRSIGVILFSLVLSILISACDGSPQVEETKVHPDIVGGTIADPNDNPFQVALLVKGIGNNSQAQFCGGSLIAPDLVVTAAHCNYHGKPSTQWKSNEVQVLTGTQSLLKGGELHDVTAIWQHPKYDPSTQNYDVSVWKLQTQVQGIPFAQLATSDGTVGSELLVTGWGSTTAGGNGSSVLLKVSVPIVSHQTCEDAYNPQGATITPQMLCAGFAQGGKDSCQGDSGGPATRGQNHMILTGIVSWGFGCADPGNYGVYTRVSDPEIRDFIRQYLEP